MGADRLQMSSSSINLFHMITKLQRFSMSTRRLRATYIPELLILYDSLYSYLPQNLQCSFLDYLHLKLLTSILSWEMNSVGRYRNWGPIRRNSTWTSTIPVLGCSTITFETRSISMGVAIGASICYDLQYFLVRLDSAEGLESFAISFGAVLICEGSDLAEVCRTKWRTNTL